MIEEIESYNLMAGLFIAAISFTTGFLACWILFFERQYVEKRRKL